MGQYLAPYLADHSWSGPPFVAGSLRAGEVTQMIGLSVAHCEPRSVLDT